MKAQYKIITLILVLFLVAPMLSAGANWDNIGQFNKNVGDYGKYEIRNSVLHIPFLQLDKVADVELTANSDSCLIDCFAEGTTTLYDSEVLFNKVDFYTVEGSKKTLPYTIYIWAEEFIEEEQAVREEIYDSQNDSYSTVVTGTETVQHPHNYWKVYDGSLMEAGEYKWRIEAQKSARENIDWIGDAFGIEFSEWAWWDTDWTNKKLINITENTAAAYNNYSVYLNVSYESAMQADFDDLRFTNGTENVELKYYIETKIDSNSAQVWVKIPKLAANEVQPIYMYYGNGAVATTSDHETAFLFSDNVTSDRTGEYSTQGVVGTWSYSANQYTLQASASSTSVVKYPTITGAALGPARIDFEVRDGTAFYVAGGSARSVGDNANYKIQKVNANIDAREIDVLKGTITTGTNSVFYNGSISAYGSNITYRATGSGGTGVVEISDATYGTGAFGVWNYGDGQTYVRNVRVRTFANPEPSVNFGDEQDEDSPPVITLDSPIEGFNTSSNDITFYCNASDSIVKNVTLWINGAINASETTDDTNLSQALTVEDGSHTWTCTARDEDNNVGSTSNRSFTVDTIEPFLNITVPSTTTVTDPVSNTSDRLIALNWTVADANLQTCWYYNNSANVTVTCGNNATFTLPYGTYTHIVYANDTLGNENSSSFSATYQSTLTDNNITFNATATETANEAFILNITYNTTTFFNGEATLHYDGDTTASTRVSSGGDSLFTATRALPLVASGEQENKTFFWEINLFNGTGQTNINTSIQTQGVNRIRLEVCNATWTDKTLNFTAQDEESLQRLNFTFEGTLNIWAGDGTTLRSQTVSNSSANELDLCIVPTGTNLKVSGTIDYNSADNSTQYNTRTYTFDEDVINDTRQDITLFLLASDESTSFIQHVIDGANNVVGAVIKTYRFFPGLNEWKIAQITTTDSDGKTIGFYKTETVDYRHEIYQGTELLLNETAGRKIFGETTPFTLTFQVGTTIVPPTLPVVVEDGQTVSLTFNNNTQVVSYSFVDLNTTFDQGELTVLQEKYNIGDITICAENSTLTSAIITCNLSGLSGEFVATGFITRDAVKEVKVRDRFSISDAINNLGVFGMLGGIFIIITAGLMFLANEIAGVLAIDAAVLLVNITGLIKFGGTALFAIFGISIIVIIALARR